MKDVAPTGLLKGGDDPTDFSPVAPLEPTPPPPDVYLSPAQVAQRTPFTVRSLEAMRSRGKGPIPISRIGRRVVYKWSDVVEWLQSGVAQ